MINNKFIANYTSWAYDFSNQYMSALRGHKYHILPTSSSPIVISIAILIFLLTLVFNLHGSNIHSSVFDSIIEFFLWIAQKDIFGNKIVINLFNLIDFSIYTNTKTFFYENIHVFWVAPFLTTLGVFFLWSSNAIEEGTTWKINFNNFNYKNILLAGKATVYPLFHTNLVWKGFKIGFILFIISEVMFFFGFFWAFFHSSISPTIQIGAVWPPLDVEFITVKGFAIANTVILLTSGATLTVAHYALELIPQKRNNLYKQNIPFTESEESFNGPLKIEYDEANKFFFNSAKPEFYWFPGARFLGKLVKESSSKTIYSFTFPFNIFLNPTKKYFDRNYSLESTEIIFWTYIGLMLDVTLLLAILFMVFQGTEYFISPVNINTGIYGSTFYMITGLHGAHVFIGTCFLFYCWTAVATWQNSWVILLIFQRLIRALVNYVINEYNKVKNRYEPKTFYSKKPKLNNSVNQLDLDDKISSVRVTNEIDHYGWFGIESFESAAWYWHFVDVVWIFVFGFVYVWSHMTVLQQQ